MFLPGILTCQVIPGVLSYEGPPHALRTIGTIPVVYIFASLGALQIYKKIHQKIVNKKILTPIFIILLIMISFLQFNKYFIKWGQNYKTKTAFSYYYVKLANYLNSLPDETEKIVVVNVEGFPILDSNGIPIPAQTLMFIENIEYGKTRSTYLLPDQIDKIKINKEPLVIVPLVKNEYLFKKLQEIFSEGEIRQENNILTYQIH